MCDICNSIYGHLENCPENQTGNGIFCFWCESRLQDGETYVTFPNKRTYCKECVKSFDLSDLLDALASTDSFDLVERFGILEISKIGDNQ